MSKKLEILGNVYSRLTVISKEPAFKNKTYWKCLCECGALCIVAGSGLISGNTKSCGCYKRDRIKQVITKHGMSNTSEYNSWYDMKRRCLDPKNDHYQDYAGRGISVHEDFVTSFSKWYEEIGEKPNDSQRWSVGRIDNNDWYTYGNIRWELDATQARNHSKQVNNVSGTTGVHKHRGTAWVAQWNKLDGTKSQKSFSCNLYGEERAKELATAYRVKMISELNLLGAGYAESHGSNKREKNE